MDTTLLHSVGRVWWLVLLRGIAAIIFGVLAWAWPGVTLITLWGGWQSKGDGGKPMWQVVLIGLLGVAAGVFTFLAPGLTAFALLILIAVWAIANGVFEIAAAIRLRKEIANEWLIILSGVISIAFGALMLANPGAGAMAVLWLIGAFAIVYGVVLVSLAFKLRKHSAPAPVAA